MISLQQLTEYFNEYYSRMDGYTSIITGKSGIKNQKSKRCVWFVDELNRSTTEVQNAMLEPILTGKIHTHRLPEGTIRIAAINPPNGKYKVSKFDPALVNRFLHIKIEANPTEWLRWAKRKNIHPTVMSFISKNEDKLFYEDNMTEQDATPRSWTKLSQNLKAYELSKMNDNDVLKTIICGKIGLAVGGQFFHYYLENSKLIEPEQVIEFVKERMEKYQLSETTYINDAQDIAEEMKVELLRDQDNITLQTLFSKLCKRYKDVGITDKDLKNNHSKRIDVLPLTILKYAVNIELIAAVYKQTKSEDRAMYAIMALSDNNFLSQRILNIKDKK